MVPQGLSLWSRPRPRPWIESSGSGIRPRTAEQGDGRIRTLRWVEPATRLAGAAALALLVSACTLGPDYRRPALPIAPAYANAPAASPVDAASQPTELAGWWRRFKDPTLDWLVDKALSGNLDLQSAAARIREARAVRTQVRSQFGPQLNYDGRTDTEQDVQLIHGVDDTGVAQRYQEQFDLSWEIDLFGRVRRETQAANASVQASVEDRRASALSVVGEVVRDYIELRGDQRQLAIAQAAVASQQKTAALRRQQYAVGSNALDDALQAEAELKQRAAEIPQLQTAIKSQIYAIGELLGRSPNALQARLEPAAAEPDLRMNVRAGVPADLLRRRPDVRASEDQLVAATAAIGVARADFYPRLNLVGMLGELIFKDPMQPFTTGFMTSGQYMAGMNFSGPIFQSGRLRGELRQRVAQRDQAEATYKQTVLRGVREVETALVSYDRETARRGDLAAAVQRDAAEARLASQRFAVGQTSLLDYLTAQQRLYTAQDQLSQSDTLLSTDLVTLFKALGGGFEPGQPGSGRPASAQPG